MRLRPSSRFRLALLAALMLSGFATAYALASGLPPGIAATTTGPKPEPPPTTSPKPEPRPPAPPPPPASTYAPPPPPPPVTATTTATVRTPVPAHHKAKRPARTHRHPRRSTPGGPTARLVRPQLSARGSNVRGVAATRLLGTGASSPGGVELSLIAALGLALLTVLGAVASARALPRQLDPLLDGRRESLAFAAICVLLAFVIVLLIAHGGS